MDKFYKFGDVIKHSTIEPDVELIVVSEDNTPGLEKVTVRHPITESLIEYSIYDMKQPYPMRTVLRGEVENRV